MEVWNLWGGLIYLIAPTNAHVDGAEVTVQVAVSAPYYKSGECTMCTCEYTYVYLCMLTGLTKKCSFRCDHSC